MFYKTSNTFHKAEQASVAFNCRIKQELGCTMNGLIHCMQVDARKFDRRKFRKGNSAVGNITVRKFRCKLSLTCGSFAVWKFCRMIF